ncbi:MAG: hypothetical protein OEY94_02050 [Alphaproteobacteria bacterium]|nr:hypothetical protein [Alphaproteobacteria bacterium]
MSGPIAGVGHQASSVTQPGQSIANDQTRSIRNEDDTPKDNKIQPREAALASSKDTNDNKSGAFQSNLNDISFSSGNDKSYSRGSVVDLVV